MTGRRSPIANAPLCAPATATATVARARRRLPLVLLALALLALTACGGAKASAGSAPRFTGTTVDGRSFDAATLAGKPTVLWFWAPWCPTCLRQGLALHDVLPTESARVNIIGIGGLAKTTDMPTFVKLTNLGTMTHVADEAGTIWKQYGVTEQSYFVFLDASGVETYRGKLPPEEIAARIAALK